MIDGDTRKRVLVCEDSQTYSAALARVLEHGQEIHVVGVCQSAESALQELQRLKPDLVTMDIELPGMSGLEAVEQIMGASPVPILVISSTVARRDNSNVAAALGAGALDVVPKDDLDLGHPDGDSAVELRRRVKVLSQAHVIRHPRARLGRPTPRSKDRGRTARVIGICASTGGPQALATLLRELPDEHAVPVLVVQHMTAGFTAGFAKWLDREIALPVAMVEGGEPLARGVWIAGEGAHLVLGADYTLALDRTTVNVHRPSGDVLLRSLAASAGSESVGVVLTGMGRDGAEGLHAIRAAGGLTMAQDAETSAVYGMPSAANESAEMILPPAAIGERLAALTPVDGR